jgi:hypothetical protein
VPLDRLRVSLVETRNLWCLVEETLKPSNPLELV